MEQTEKVPKKRGRRKKEEIIASAVEEFRNLQKEQMKLFEFLLKENDRLKLEVEKNKKYREQYLKIAKMTSTIEEGA